MERNRCSPTIGVVKLFVRPALPNLDEAETVKQADDLLRRKNRHAAHISRRYRNELRADELTFEHRLAVFEQHLDHFAHVAVKLVERFALRMRTREAGHVANEQAGFGVAFDDEGIVAHERSSLMSL